MNMRKYWYMFFLVLLAACLVVGAAVAEGHGTAETAMKVTLGKAVKDSLAEDGAENYYKFTTTKAGYVTVTFTHAQVADSYVWWRLKLADRDSIEDRGSFGGFSGLLLDSFEEKGKEKTTTRKLGIPAGTYYIRIEGGNSATAEYSLKVNFTASSIWETEKNDKTDDADPIRVNTEYWGALLTSGNFYCQPKDNFTFTLKKAQYVSLRFKHTKLSTTDICWNVSLMDADTKRLYSKTYEGNSAAQDFSELFRLEPGKYYVSVSCWVYGNGNVSYSETPYRLTVLTQPNTVTVSGGKYKLDHEKLTAVLRAPADKAATALTIPATVKVNGTTYKVTGIAASACKDMAKLKKLTIGKNVKTIGKKAFYGCGALKTIVINTKKLTEETVGASAFKGIHAKATVTCPAGKAAAYRKLLKAKGMGSKVKFSE